MYEFVPKLKNNEKEKIYYLEQLSQIIKRNQIYLYIERQHLNLK
jgi:hypothetical protein